MTSIDPRNYLAFHTVAEFASVVLACLVFWIAWHGNTDRRRGGLRWLGGCLLAAALLDSAHALSYEGMPQFITASGTEKAIAFWLPARLLMALGLLGATMVGDQRFAGRQERVGLLAALLAFDAAVAWLVLAHGGDLPRTYVVGEGLTPAKRATEWVLIALLAWAAARLVLRARAGGAQAPAHASWLLAGGCAVAAVGEWCFTRYVQVTGSYDVVGHVCKVLAYFLIYRAVYLATVRLPLAHLNELATALRSAANAVAVTDAAGVVRWANDAFGRMTGLGLAELTGRPLSALGRPEDSAGPLPMPKIGSSWQGRVHGQRADGEAYVEQRTITPMASEFGNVVGYVCVGDDVTERSRSELAIKESEERLRALFDAAPDCIVVIDHEGQVEHANPQVEALFGYSPQELRGCNVAMLMPAADARRHDGFLQRYQATGERHIMGRGRDVVGRHKDGRPLHLHLTVGEMRLRDGPHFIGFVRDVSERLERERRYLALTERFELAMRGTNDGVWDRDLVEGAVWLSPTWKAMLGYQEAELADRWSTFVELTDPLDATRVLGAIDAFIADPTRERAELEFRMRHREGHRVNVLCRVFAQRDGAGRAVRLVGTHQDLTERIEQQRLHDELQRRLMQAQKMEALGQLTGGVAHDFNNILAGVLGLSRLALDRYVDDADGKLAQYLREIVKVSERGRNLVAKMLAFGRREALPPAEPMDLAPQVQEVVRLLCMEMPDGVMLQVTVDDGVPAVRLGMTELHQLLANLVLNARDAVGERGRIGVRLSHGSAEGQACSSCGAILTGNWVRLSVSDDGEGMPPERLARIFEPFFTTKQIGKGSGLGLPMVQGVVHACNGHISVRSGPRQGTVMELLLPPAGQPQPERVQAAPGREAPASKPLRTWVIDDDPVVSLYLCEMLALQGHDVVPFSDPAHALARFLAAPEEPDVVITDHAMPDLPGDDLARAMLEVRPDLPVILCTGNSDGLDEQRARAAGIRQVLHKPFEAAALVDALSACAPA